MGFAGLVTFTFILRLGHIWLLYLTGALLGFFMIGYLSVGYEFAAELTFPVPEGTSTGLLNACSELFGFAFTLFGGKILDNYGDMATNLTFCSLLVVGLAMTLAIRGSDLRRQAASQPKGGDS